MLFGSPYNISQEDTLAALYHVGEMKTLQRGLAAFQAEEGGLLEHLSGNIRTIESSIETKVVQLVKEILRKKLTPEELMEQADKLALVKYGFELAQRGEQQLYESLVEKLQTNLVSSVKLEALNIAKLSSSGIDKSGHSELSFLNRD